MPPALPACGFKEWSLVCRALGAGAQSLLLRKGGIHEGKGGFWWRHQRFFLFPTHFHEQAAQFTWNDPNPLPPNAPEGSAHSLFHFAEVESKHQIADWETLRRLADFHFYTEATLRERFDYSEASGISLAFLRVYRLDQPWTFPEQPSFGGCRSWLDLPNPPEGVRLTPVLDDPSHEARRQALAAALGQAA